MLLVHLWARPLTAKPPRRALAHVASDEGGTREGLLRPNGEWAPESRLRGSDGWSLNGLLRGDACVAGLRDAGPEGQRRTQARMAKTYCLLPGKLQEQFLRLWYWFQELFENQACSPWAFYSFQLFWDYYTQITASAEENVHLCQHHSLFISKEDTSHMASNHTALWFHMLRKVI